MQAMRRRNTDPEIRARRALHRLGYRFRLHRKDLPGTPDIVLPGHRKIIFVHGCFWHSHADCKRARLPKNNAEIWRTKVRDNQARDDRNIVALRQLGWNVMIIWECETSDPSFLSERLQNFMRKE